MEIRIRRFLELSDNFDFFLIQLFEGLSFLVSSSFSYSFHPVFRVIAVFPMILAFVIQPSKVVSSFKFLFYFQDRRDLFHLLEWEYFC